MSGLAVPLWSGILTRMEELLGGVAPRGLCEGREWSFICGAFHFSSLEQMPRALWPCLLSMCLSVLPCWHHWEFISLSHFFDCDPCVDKLFAISEVYEVRYQELGLK